MTTMKKTTFKQCAAGDVFEHQGQALIKTIARHEIATDLAAVVRSAAALLKNGGRFFLIHQADLPSEMPDSLKGGRNNG